MGLWKTLALSVYSVDGDASGALDFAMNAPQRVALGAPTADPNLIFDIGMDACQDTELYLKKGFRVVGVDANPAACEAARRRFPKEVASGRLFVVNAAISEGSEPLAFHVCNEKPMLSTADDEMRRRQERDGETFRTVTVAATNLADLTEAFGTPYFLKVDIEGFDLLCLRGLLRTTARPALLSTELDFRALAAHLRCVRALGYRRFALVGQGSVPRQRLPRPALEGLDADHTFAIHSSGLFGKELPEAWFPVAQLEIRCWWIQALFWLTGGLRRLEALPPLRRTLRALRERLPVSGQWYDLHCAL